MYLSATSRVPATLDPPLRVLHLNSLLTGGGTDDQCIKLVFGLRERGHDVRLAGPAGREQAQTAVSLGIPLYATPSEGPAKFRLILAAARYIRQERVTIVHGHHGRDLWPTILAARLSGVRPRIVLTRHLAKSPSSWFSRRFLLGQCDALIAVSEFTARVLREGHQDPHSPERERWARPPLLGDCSRIQVIYGGIDTRRFQPGNGSALRLQWGTRPEHFVFAVVGGYNAPRGKGQREFLEAAALVHQSLPQARFLIVGRGNLAAVLQSDIERLGLQGKAWLTPYCTDMPLAMNAIDCLVHPQIGTEAFGLVLLEAFACGKPVIASALDGIPEAFAAGRLGCLVEPESIEALAQAMRAQGAASPLSESGRRELHSRIEARFSLSVMARNVAELYGKLVPSG